MHDHMPLGLEQLRDEKAKFRSEIEALAASMNN